MNDYKHYSINLISRKIVKIVKTQKE